MLNGTSMSAKELSKILPIEHTSISPILDKLKERELIKRYRATIDKREIKVYLTDKGYEILKKVNPDIVAYVRFTYGSLSPQEAKTFVKLMCKIRNRGLEWNKKGTDGAERVLEQLTHLNRTDSK